MEQEKKAGKGLAIASLVLGILSVINSFIPVINFVAYILAALAIIFGIIGIVKKKGAMAIVGLALGGVAIITASIINLSTASVVDDALDDSGLVETTEKSSKSISKTREYLKVDLDTMNDELDNNAAAAKDKYYGKYVEVTGKLGTIDSDLAYISLHSLTDSWDIIGIHCNIKNQETREVVKTLSKDQTITVKGKITDVGEVLGYYLSIDEIISQ